MTPTNYDDDHGRITERLTGPTFVELIAAAPGTPRDVATQIAEVANEALLEARDAKARRAAEVLDRWGSAIDRLETLAWLQQSMRDRFTNDVVHPLLELHVRGEPQDEATPNRLMALGEIAHRAALCGEEILELVKAGLAPGAFVRWRTLHELTVVGAFIHDHGDEEAMRWRTHERLQFRRVAKAYNVWARLNDQEQISRRELGKFAESEEQLRGRFGQEFEGDYGWAHEALLAHGGNYERHWRDGRRPSGPSFLDLCLAAELDDQHLLYRIASNLIHGGDASLIGTSGGDSDPFLASATVFGVDWVAPRTARSLQLATAFYVLAYPDPPADDLSRAQKVSAELAELVSDACVEAGGHEG